MSRKTRRLKRERINRGLAYLKRNINFVENNPTEQALPEQNIAKSAFKIATTWWMYPVLLLDLAARHPKLAATLSYLASTILYAGLAAVFGYSFLAVFGIFVGILGYSILTSATLCWYEELICESNVFYSRNSWFRRCIDFADCEDERLIRTYMQKIRFASNIFFSVFHVCIVLPIYTVAQALVITIVAVTLFLDWMRLLAIGFVNLCFKITPKMMAWTYIFGVIMGASIAFLLFSHIVANILMGAYLGGLAWIFVLFWKDGRERKHGTPYFPT